MSLTGQLQGFEGITLEEMDAIKLMNRVDTKFVTTLDVLSEFLELARGRYRVFEVNAERLNLYDTVYYDTASLQMYLAHHNRRLVRQKIRVRTYVTTGVTYLEIKKKNNKGRTKKKRIQCSPYAVFDSAGAEFLQRKSGYQANELHPRLKTRFERITLVNNAKTERLTIDTALQFECLDNGRTASLGNGVVIELKQDGLMHSDALEILRELRVHPFKISKYCIGSVLTDPELKQNRFKQKVRKIEKMTNSKLI